MKKRVFLTGATGVMGSAGLADIHSRFIHEGVPIINGNEQILIFLCPSGDFFNVRRGDTVIGNVILKLASVFLYPLFNLVLCKISLIYAVVRYEADKQKHSNADTESKQEVAEHRYSE